jgi:hypothetical protein
MTAKTSIVGRAAGARETLWLSVRFGRENWLFELAPNDEHAIVVGNWRRAHVPINRREVAPIHFHLERDGDAIRLIPGYGNDVRVNGRLLIGSRLLEPRSCVEFAGLVAEVAFFSIESGVLAEVRPRGSEPRLDATCVAFPVDLTDTKAPPLPQPAGPERMGALCLSPPIKVRIEPVRPERGPLVRLLRAALRWFSRVRALRGVRRARRPVVA